MLSKSTSNLSKQTLGFLLSCFWFEPVNKHQSSLFFFLSNWWCCCFFLTSPSFFFVVVVEYCFRKFDTNKIIPHYTLLSFLVCSTWSRYLKSLCFLHTSTCYHALVNLNQICLFVWSLLQRNNQYFGYTVPCASRCCCSFVLISTQIPHSSIQMIN